MNLPTVSVLINGTDVTPYVLLVNGYGISRGRDDWQGAVTAGELTLTLNNSDGRFTPGSTILGVGGFDYLPFGVGPFDLGGGTSLAVDALIVLKETVNGVAYTRFTGYVKSWPVAWPATVATFSTVSVTATDAQARAERRTMASMLEEQVAVDLPTAYFMLAEAEGATSAGDTSGHQVPPLTKVGTGVTFGTGTGPADTGMSAVQMTGTGYLTSGLVNLLSNTAWTVECWVQVATPPAAAMGVFDLPATSPATALAIDTSGRPYIGLAVGSNVCDGAWHHLALTFAGGVNLWVDGAMVGSASGSGSSASFGIRVGTATGLANFVGFMFGVGTYSTALGFASIAAHYQLGVGLPELAGPRVFRVAGYANLPILGTASMSTTVAAASSTGKSAWDVMQEAIDAEMGALYINGSGNVATAARTFLPLKVVPDLTLDHQWITPDVQPVVDDQQIVNYFEGTSAKTGAPSLVRNAASEAAHGRYPTSQTYLVQTDAEVIDRANWIVANFAEPSVRFGTLTINLYAMTQAMASSVLAAVEVNCWLRVTSMASQTPGGTTVDVVVQGWRETVSADTWTIQCNVVAYALFSPTWRLDTSALDTTTRLYV